MKVESKKLLLRWIAVALWLGVIYFFSNQPNLKSGFDTPIDFVLRKIAHVVEYAVLAFLVFRATFLLQENRRVLLTVIFCVLAALFDEWHQLFVPGRSGSLKDVFVDCVGVASYLGLYYYTSYANLRRN